MADPIQSKSTVPLPIHQEIRSDRDPFPTNSTKGLNESNQQVRDAAQLKETKNFEDYLNQKGVFTVGKSVDELLFDTVKDLEKSSVYSAPGQSNPV